MAGLNKKPLCLFCAHYNGLLKCNAYPNGIPDDILDDDVLHNRVFDDQKTPVVFKFNEQSRHVTLNELLPNLE